MFLCRSSGIRGWAEPHTSSPLYCFRQCISRHVLASQKDTTSKSFPLRWGEKTCLNIHLKLTSVTLILHWIKCIDSTLMRPLMLLMVELSSELTLWSLLTLSAYRRHMKMMYAGSPGMKLTATPRGFRSGGHEKKDLLNVCPENLH